MSRSLATPAGVAVAVAAVLVVAALMFLPLLGSFWTSFGLQLCIWVVLAVSWNVFSGFSGYPSFGHGVFFGVGVYAAATLLTRTDLPFVVALAAAAAVPALLAATVGAAIFLSPRFKGDVFGLVTLALTFVVATIVANTPAIDGGSGVFVRGGTQVFGGGPDGLYRLALLLAAGTVVVSFMVARTRWGRGLAAIRDDEQVAEGLGVPTYRYKVVTFAVSAGLAGLAGVPEALFLGYVEVGTTFALSIPLFVIMMAILGGMTTWYGPLIGAVVVVALQEYLIGLGPAEVNQIVLGLVLVVLILLWPRGVGGEIERRTSPRGSR